jgi:hypothetical protein
MNDPTIRAEMRPRRPPEVLAGGAVIDALGAGLAGGNRQTKLVEPTGSFSNQLFITLADWNTVLETFLAEESVGI